MGSHTFKMKWFENNNETIACDFRHLSKFTLQLSLALGLSGNIVSSLLRITYLKYARPGMKKISTGRKQPNGISSHLTTRIPL